MLLSLSQTEHLWSSQIKRICYNNSIDLCVLMILKDTVNTSLLHAPQVIQICISLLKSYRVLKSLWNSWVKRTCYKKTHLKLYRCVSVCLSYTENYNCSDKQAASKNHWTTEQLNEWLNKSLNKVLSQKEH